MKRHIYSKSKYSSVNTALNVSAYVMFFWTVFHEHGDNGD